MGKNDVFGELNFDSDIEFDESGSEQQDNSLDFDNDNDFGIDNSNNGGSHKKTSLVAICCGIVLIIVVFSVVALISKHNKSKDNTVEANEQVNTEQASETNNASTVDTSNTSSAVANSNLGINWVAIDDKPDGLDSIREIDSEFTVNAIYKYAGNAGGTSYQLKTVLLGTIDGIEGNYEIEVPYIQGLKISTGMKFIVHLKIANTFNNELMVCEIKYD